jgi:hypothetical protein
MGVDTELQEIGCGGDGASNSSDHVGVDMKVWWRERQEGCLEGSCSGKATIEADVEVEDIKS